MSFEQRDLEQLSRELKEFTQELNSFNTKSSGKLAGGTSTQNITTDPAAKSFDKGTEKIVNALGLLAAQLAKKDRSESQKTKHIDEFNKSVEKATETQKKKQESDDKLKAQKDKELEEEKSRQEWRKKSFEERRKIVEQEKAEKKKDEIKKQKEQTAKDISSLTSRENTNKFADSLLDARLAGNVFSSKLSESSTATQVTFAFLQASVQGATDAIKSYSSAIYKGERGSAVAADSASKLVNPLLELGKTIGSTLMTLGSIAAFIGRFTKWIPGWGKGIGILGKGAALGGVALYGLAAGTQKYIELQKLGAEQTDKLFKSYQTLSKSGLATSGGIDDLYDKLHRLGMSVSEVEQFTKLMTSGSKSLAMFGGMASKGAEKFTEFTGELVNSGLGRSLRMLGVSAEEQRETAMWYMGIQVKTGQLQDRTTQALVKSTARVIKEMDMMAELTGASVEEQKKAAEAAAAEDRFQAAMDDARAAGDSVRLVELENAKMMHDMLFAMGNTQAAKAALQYGAGGFSSEIGTQFAMQYLGGQGIRNDKVLTKEDTIKTLNTGLGQSIEGGRGVRPLLEGGKIPGIELSGAATAISEREFFKSVQEMMKENPKLSLDEILEKRQQQRIAQGGKIEAQVGSIMNQEKAAQVMDSAVNKFYKSSDIIKNGTDIFAKAVEKFGGMVGVKPSAQTNVQPPSPSSAPPAPPAPSQLGNFNRMSGASTSSSGKPVQDGGLIDPRLQGLNVKVGDVHRPGAKLDDRIPALAAKIQSEVAGFDRFTGFNDAHQRSKGSKHPEGKAVDFTLGYFPTREQGAEIVKQLKDIGFNYALDEYNYPSRGSTAPHIHAQLARTGGIFRGPSTGYNVELHGDEMVVPMNEGVSKQALNTSVFNQDTSMIDRMIESFRVLHDQNYQIIDLLSRQADNGDKLVQAAY